MNLLPLASGEATGALVMLFLGVVGLIIAVSWIVFPFIVISKCNEMIKLLSRIDSRPELARSDVESIKAPLTSLREAGSEICKGLQWMIDNWSERRD